jgi:hypothetical protein
MAEPSVAELDGFGTLADVAAWAGVSEATLALFETSFGAARGDANIRGLGSATAAEFNVQVDTIRLADGSALTFLARQTLILLGRVCRLSAGLEPTRAEVIAAAALVAAAAPALPAAPGVPAHPAGRVGMVKLCDTIDQTNSDEVPVMTEALHMRAIERYIHRMGAEPVEDVEPSLEQFTSIVHLLTLGAPP